MAATKRTLDIHTYINLPFQIVCHRNAGRAGSVKLSDDLGGGCVELVVEVEKLVE